MRRALAAVLALAVLAVAPAATTATRPALKLTKGPPLTIQGLHFKARERVTVTLYTKGSSVRHATATRSGTFTVKFDTDTATDRCSTGIRLYAVGKAGSRAAIKLPQFGCMPARSGGITS